MDFGPVGCQIQSSSLRPNCVGISRRELASLRDIAMTDIWGEMLETGPQQAGAGISGEGHVPTPCRHPPPPPRGLAPCRCYYNSRGCNPPEYCNVREMTGSVIRLLAEDCQVWLYVRIYLSP
jgi:hypothetical protein